MALTIEHPAVEELARELAKRTGESVDNAVVTGNPREARAKDRNSD